MEINEANRLQWLLAAATNLYLFFLCSTKWNAGYSISGGILAVLILWFYLKKRKKFQCASRLFFTVYGIFMAGVLLASCLTGDKPSIHVAQKFLSYSVPMWLLYLILQQVHSIRQASLPGMVIGSWVLLGASVRELWTSPGKDRLCGSFASANNFAVVLEAILPFLWMQVWALRKNKKSPAFLLTLITSIGLTGCLLLSASRGGIAGFLLGFVGVVILKGIQKTTWGLKKRVGVLLLTGCLAAGALFAATLRYQHRSYDSERLLLLQSAYAMWQDNKLYGVGFQRWNQVYRSGYILPGAKEPTLSLPHNNIANFFSGTGVLGGTGYLLFTFGSLGVLLCTLRKHPANEYARMMFWVWIAIFVHGIVDNSLYAKFNTRLYFAMWGIFLAASLDSRKERLKK